MSDVDAVEEAAIDVQCAATRLAMCTRRLRARRRESAGGVSFIELAAEAWHPDGEEAGKKMAKERDEKLSRLLIEAETLVALSERILGDSLRVFEMLLPDEGEPEPDAAEVH